MSFHVELLVYSGRPNPTWQLLPQQEEVFIDLLNALPRGIQNEPFPDSLGYCGLKVAGRFTVNAYRQNVQVQVRDHWMTFWDPQKRVETYLLRTMRPYKEELVRSILYGR